MAGPEKDKVLLVWDYDSWSNQRWEQTHQCLCGIVLHGVGGIIIRLYMNPYLPSRAMILSTTQMTKQSLQIFQHCCFRWKIPTWEWHVCNGKTWSTSRAPLKKPAVGCSQPPIPYHLPIPIRQGLEFDQRQFCRLIALRSWPSSCMIYEGVLKV